MKPTSLLNMALLLAFLLACAAPASAQEGNGIALSAQAGFEGYCRSRTWIPVRIVMENQGPGVEARLEAIVPGDPPGDTVYAQPVSLPTGSRKEAFLSVFPEAYISSVDVRLVVDGRVAAQTETRVTCMEANDLLSGVVADELGPYSSLADIDPPAGSGYLAEMDLEDIPANAPALEALDVLVIAGVDTGPLTPGQREALTAWVAGGGTLIVTGGPSWQRTAAGLEEVLPFRPAGTESVGGLEALLVEPAGRQDLSGQTLVAAGEVVQGSQVHAAQDELPLVVSRQTGRGRVIYLTFDPGLEPFRGWQDKEAFYASLLEDQAPEPSWSAGFQSWSAAVDAVTRLPSQGLPHWLLIAGFLVLYILAIGPLNYLLLRVWKRRELAWVSIPVFVLLFSGLAFVIGAQARGGNPILNRIAVVQAWPGAGLARVDGILGVFSPSRDRYQLALEPPWVAHPVPESPSVARRGGWELVEQPEAGWVVPDVRIDVAGMNALAVQGYVPAPDFVPELVFRLSDGFTSLEGEVLNASDLTLEDAVLLAPGGALELGTLGPNQRAEVDMILQSTDQASPGSSSPAGPFTAPPTISGTPWLTSLVGSPDYYTDPVAFRRFSVVNALTNYNFTNYIGANGFYLAGWSESSPITAGLSGEEADEYGLTLYLVRLTPQLAAEGERVQVPPSLFAWRVLENGNLYMPSPYGVYLESGSLGLSFTPIQAIPFGEVESLVLHLTSYGAAGPTDFDVSLWDFTVGEWALQPVESWGDHEIQDPARYVGPDGEIRLTLDNSGDFSPASIERADFTLTISPDENR